MVVALVRGAARMGERDLVFRLLVKRMWRAVPLVGERAGEGRPLRNARAVR